MIRMIDVACNNAFCASSSPIRPRHRSSTICSTTGVDRFAGGPPDFNHELIVAG